MEPVPFIGVSRHRIGVDGIGVTTLAAFHGCPLRCRYCLNPACLGSADRLYRYTPESLFEKVRIDNLYFLATGGGICFGGGEPLLTKKRKIMVPSEMEDVILKREALTGGDLTVEIEGGGV